MPWIECPSCTAHVSLVMVPSEHSGYFVSDRDIEAWTDCRVPVDLWEWLRVRRGEGRCIVRGYRCPQCGRLWADGDDALARSTPGYDATELAPDAPDALLDEAERVVTATASHCPADCTCIQHALLAKLRARSPQ